MPRKTVLDYDKTSIPAGYDRARDHGPALLDLWMRTVESTTRGRSTVNAILDLGCGTGRFSFALADHFQAAVLGLDPSKRMLEQARAKPHNSLVRFGVARGENLPLPDRTIDLVFQSMVFHHFSSPGRVASECRRVLRGDGVVFMRAGTTDRVPTYPYVPFFPSSVPLLHEILPSCAGVRDVFEAAGFRTIAQELLVQQIAATHAEYADKLEAGGDSVLAQLSQSDFDAGLARLRAHCQRIDPRPVTEAIDFFAFS